MNRAVQAVVLVAVGSAVLRISLTGDYLRYVKEGLQPLLVVAAVATMLLGLLTILFDTDTSTQAPDADARREVPGSDAARDHEHGDHEHRDHKHGDHEHGDHEHGDHEHGDHRHGPRVAWLLVLPVLAMLVGPPALGSFAAARDTGAVAAPSSATYPVLPPGDPTQIPLFDYAERATWDQGRSLQGRTVQLTGFVTPGGDGTWYLARMSLNCCAADASATKIEVRNAPAPPTDSWVEVTGTYVVSTDPADGLAAMEAMSISSLPVPENSYE